MQLAGGRPLLQHWVVFTFGKLVKSDIQYRNHELNQRPAGNRPNYGEEKRAFGQ